MHRIPMPSPRGTNFAGRFLPASFPFTNEPTMAMDAAMRPERKSVRAPAAYEGLWHGFRWPDLPAAVERLLRFVAPKLSPHALAEVRALATEYNDLPTNALERPKRDLPMTQ
jgi:hypothetical protein